MQDNIHVDLLSWIWIVINIFLIFRGSLYGWGGKQVQKYILHIMN